MLLIIIRHGIAEDREMFKLKDKNDGNRPLTTKGKKKFQSIAKKLKKFLGPIDLIVSSPLLRAQQTAQLLQEEYPHTPLLSSDTLSPHSTPKEFTQWFHEEIEKGAKQLVIIGHEPQLGLLASWLLLGSQQSQIKIKKGGCLGIKISSPMGPRKGVLLWALTPKSLFL